MLHWARRLFSLWQKMENSKFLFRRFHEFILHHLTGFGSWVYNDAVCTHVTLREPLLHYSRFPAFIFFSSFQVFPQLVVHQLLPLKVSVALFKVGCIIRWWLDRWQQQSDSLWGLPGVQSVHGPGSGWLPHTHKGCPRAGLRQGILQWAVRSRCVLQGMCWGGITTCMVFVGGDCVQGSTNKHYVLVLFCVVRLYDRP